MSGQFLLGDDGKNAGREKLNSRILSMCETAWIILLSSIICRLLESQASE